MINNSDTPAHFNKGMSSKYVMMFCYLFSPMIFALRVSNDAVGVRNAAFSVGLVNSHSSVASYLSTIHGEGC